MKRSKAYRAAAEKVVADNLYTPLEAVRLAKQTSVTKYDFGYAVPSLKSKSVNWRGGA